MINLKSKCVSALIYDLRVVHSIKIMYKIYIIYTNRWHEECLQAVAATSVAMIYNI